MSAIGRGHFLLRIVMVCSTKHVVLITQLKSSVIVGLSSFPANRIADPQICSIWGSIAVGLNRTRLK